jgi:hypothetical protein
MLSSSSTTIFFSILETNSEYPTLVTSNDAEVPFLETEILVRPSTIVPLCRRQLRSDVVCPTNPNGDDEASETLLAAEMVHDHVPLLTSWQAKSYNFCRIIRYDLFPFPLPVYCTEEIPAGSKPNDIILRRVFVELFGCVRRRRDGFGFSPCMTALLARTKKKDFVAVPKSTRTDSTSPLSKQ